MYVCVSSMCGLTRYITVREKKIKKMGCILVVNKSQKV